MAALDALTSQRLGMTGYKGRWGSQKGFVAWSLSQLSAGVRLEEARQRPADSFIKYDDMHVKWFKVGHFKGRLL